MTSSITLDSAYSTTRNLFQCDPQDIQEELKAAQKTDDKFETVLFLPEGENRQGEGGLRTRGYFKKSSEGKPLISIITVVFNGEKYLEEAIQSVINQTYDNVEYIIIDGGSTDGTLDIIKKYEGQVDYWVSESDKGIYDAMNKGVTLVTGEWINFMNGGDQFFQKGTLQTVFLDQSYDNIDIIYGDLNINFGDFERIQKAGNMDDLWKGMIFSHQSAFISASLQKKTPYDLTYKIASDFNFFYKVFILKQRFLHIDKVISVVSNHGLCDSNHFKVLRECYQISKAYNVFHAKCYLYFGGKAIQVGIKNGIKRILGRKLSHLVKRLK